MYMFRYRRAKNCKACVVNDTNSCATNITIAQPRNAPPRPNREKAIKTEEDGLVVPTFVPNQNSVQDSYFKLAMGNRKVNTLLNPIPNMISRAAFDPNKYLRTAYAEHVGSMGRMARLKAKAISGDRKLCLPIVLGQLNTLDFSRDATTIGYVDGKTCANIPACGTSLFGSINNCSDNGITLLGFYLLAMESSNFPNAWVSTSDFKIIWRRKTGILSGSTPSFTRLAIKGVKQSDNQEATATLNFSDSTGATYVFGNDFPGEDTITVSWDPSVVSGAALVNDILNGTPTRRVEFQFI